MIATKTPICPTKAPVRFKLNLDKLISCIGLFVKEDVKDLTRLKICKMIYFADKYHLLKYGRPIIGDNYVHMDYGPVPSKTLDILRNIDEPFPIKYDRKKSNYSKVNKFLVAKALAPSEYPVYVLKSDPGVDDLSETEIEAVKETIIKYGHYKPAKLVDLTHKDAAWRKTENNDDIDYELFFEGERNLDKTALEYFRNIKIDSERFRGLGFNF